MLRRKTRGFFDKFKGKKESTSPDFGCITSNEQAQELAKQGIPVPLYLMPLQFGGVDDVRNIVYVPPIVVELKARYDAMVEDLLVEDKVNGYTASPDYKGASFVPSSLQIVAKKDGEPVSVSTIPATVIFLTKNYLLRCCTCLNAVTYVYVSNAFETGLRLVLRVSHHADIS